MAVRLEGQGSARGLEKVEPWPPSRGDGRPSARRVPGSALLVLLAGGIVVAAVGSVRAPLIAVGLPVAIALLIVLLRRVDLAAVAVIASTPFDRYLKLYVDPNAFKAFGVLLLVSFAVSRMKASSPQRRQPLSVAVSVFLILMLAAAIAHPNGAQGLTTVQRYLSFGLTCLVLVFVLQRDLAPDIAVAAYVYACTAASCFALYNFISGGSTRASGPVDDPNDLAYMLAAAIPFALWLSARRGRLSHLLFALVLALGAAGTLSRGAAIAAVAMLVVAFWRGHIPTRALIGGAVASVLAGLLLVTLAHDVVQTALTQKAYIAAYNVDTRALRWHGAILMTEKHPILGVGPSGFRQNYLSVSDHAEPAEPTPVSHDMYLEVSSELGLPALAAFIAILGLAWAGAGRARQLTSGKDSSLASTAQIALLGVLTASIFLTEQYYLTLWFVLGLSAALLGRAQDRDRDERPVPVP